MNPETADPAEAAPGAQVPAPAAPAAGAPPSPGRRAEPRAVRRERAARDALRTLVRDHYLYRFGTPAPGANPFSLTISLAVAPDADWAVDFDPPFEEQVLPQIEDAQAVRGVYVPGRVHCFRCRSSTCEHSGPPHEGSVFRGYSPQGVPEWCEFAQTLLDARDERVDQLYAPRPPVLARTQTGHELRSRQLASFGRASRTFSILGQAVSGYYHPGRRRGAPAPGAGGKGCAITFQVVETRQQDGRMGLRLNIIPGGLSDEEWIELLGSDRYPELAQAVTTAAQSVERLERRIVAAREAGLPPAELQPLFRLVPRTVHILARDLERAVRSGARRTLHAMDRRHSRPVANAFEEAQAAGDADLLYDERKRTFVALRAGHAHVFTAEGRHVTTLLVPPDGAESRRRRGRWRPLTSEETAAFRSRLAAGRT